jgi:hypothetical protein
LKRLSKQKGHGFGFGRKKKLDLPDQCMQLHYFVNISANFASTSNPKIVSDSAR